MENQSCLVGAEGQQQLSEWVRKTQPIGPVERETEPKILGESVHFWLCFMCQYQAD